jgi:hypothetical protein
MTEHGKDMPKSAFFRAIVPNGDEAAAKREAFVFRTWNVCLIRRLFPSSGNRCRDRRSGGYKKAHRFYAAVRPCLQWGEGVA